MMLLKNKERGLNRKVQHSWEAEREAGKIPWNRKWQPTPVLLPGNPVNWGTWWATVHGVRKRQTQLSMNARGIRGYLFAGSRGLSSLTEVHLKFTRLVNLQRRKGTVRSAILYQLSKPSHEKALLPFLHTFHYRAPRFCLWKRNFIWQSGNWAKYTLIRNSILYRSIFNTMFVEWQNKKNRFKKHE